MGQGLFDPSLSNILRCGFHFGGKKGESKKVKHKIRVLGGYSVSLLTYHLYDLGPVKLL